MRKAILLINILLISFSAKSQVVWNSGFVKALEKFYFIPVEFEHFGNWIEEMEKDSSLIFNQKMFTVVDDSLHLLFDIEKPGSPSPFINSALSVTLQSNTRKIHNLKEIVEKSSASIDIKRLDPIKVTTIYLISKISFDSTKNGKSLAAEAMTQLEKEFSTYFNSKRSYKSSKNIRRRTHHPKLKKN